jgi:hypothetical protein
MEEARINVAKVDVVRMDDVFVPEDDYFAMTCPQEECVRMNEGTNEILDVCTHLTSGCLPLDGVKDSHVFCSNNERMI